MYIVVLKVVLKENGEGGTARRSGVNFFVLKMSFLMAHPENHLKY